MGYFCQTLAWDGGACCFYPLGGVLQIWCSLGVGVRKRLRQDRAMVGVALEMVLLCVLGLWQGRAGYQEGCMAVGQVGGLPLRPTGV